MSLFDNISFDDELDVPVGVQPVTEKTPEESTDENKPDNKKDVQEIEDGDLIDVVVGKAGKTSNPTETGEFGEEEFDEQEFSEETDEETPQKPKGSSSSSPYKPFVKALSEEGFLPSVTDEEFDNLVKEHGSPSLALMELSKKAILGDIEEYKKNAEGDFKAFLEARDAGLDLNQWADVQELKNFYGSITEDKISDDEDLQKQLVAENLRYRGMNEDEITETIDAFETTGKLEDNAKKALKNLNKFAAQQEDKLKQDKIAEEESFKKTREENLKNLKKEIESVNEIIPGIKVNKQIKDKLFADITTVVKTGPNGEQYNAAMAKRAEDPIKYALIENYLIQMGVFDGKWDKVVTRTKAKALTELERQLSNASNTDFKSGKNTLGDGGSDNDIDFNLSSFKRK